MNKQLKKSILTLGLSILLTTPTFASAVTQPTNIVQTLEANGYKYDEVMKVLKDGYKTYGTVAQKKYNAVIKTVDKYGNVLVPSTEYHGKFTAEQPVIFEHTDKVLSNAVIKATRPYYYKPINQKYTVDKANQEIKITFVPTKVVNTVSGTVKFPHGTDLTNTWIQVKGTVNGKLQDAVLKVNKDGTFKVENLMDGTYTFTPFVGTFQHKSGTDFFNYTSKFNPVTVEVKGNTTVNIDAPAKEKRNWLFEQADYSDMSKFTGVTPMLEMPQELKDITDKLYSEDTVQFLKNIFEYKNGDGGFTTSNDVSYSIDDDRTIEDIYKSKHLAHCGDNAVLVNAMLRYKGVPTMMVQTARTDGYVDNMIQGHEYLEVYLEKEGKWVLTDTTGNTICLDYDMNNPFTQIYDDTMTQVTFNKALTPEDRLSNSDMKSVTKGLNKLTNDLKLDPSSNNVNKQVK